MTNFLKIASRITGTNYNRLMQSTDKSRTKVLALGLAVLIPVTIWAICSFLLVYAVVNAGVLVALISALVMGFLVLTIERLVVMGNGHVAITVFRILLAFTVAWLGAQLFDLVLFRNDIDLQLPQIRHEVAMKAQSMKQQGFDERNGIAEKNRQVARYDSIFLKRQQEAVEESAGLAGSGMKGAGSATAFKKGVANESKADVLRMKAELDRLMQQSGGLQTAAYDSATSRFNDKSILYRMKAMNQLLAQNSEMSTMYWGITIFLFLIEFLVIIFKITWPKSAYEKELDMLEKLHEQRTQRMMGIQTAMQQPHHLDETVRSKSQRLTIGLNGFL